MCKTLCIYDSQMVNCKGGVGGLLVLGNSPLLWGSLLYVSVAVCVLCDECLIVCLVIAL
mgnify:FL=1